MGSNIYIRQCDHADQIAEMARCLMRKECQTLLFDPIASTTPLPPRLGLKQAHDGFYFAKNEISAATLWC